MSYIDPDGNYPRFIGDIRLDNPNWQVGDTLPTGWKEVVETEPPAFDIDLVTEELAPELRDGIYYQKWNQRPMTADEKAYRDAPLTLKAKLTELGLTDWEIQALRNGLVGA